jgi:hypothetical protein
VVKLNLGCGDALKEGWTNVDLVATKEDVFQWDLRTPWPWDDNSVEEAFSAHFIEHLESMERCHFWNELYRVLQPGAKVQIHVPHWSSGRSYGDPTHKWPPVSEAHFFYLRKEWRDQNAPHTNSILKCDFEATWGYGMSPDISTRNVEYQQFAVNNYREAVWDIIATLTKL